MMNEFNSYFNEVFKEYKRGESGGLRKKQININDIEHIGKD
jgi:hypothetical protein